MRLAWYTALRSRLCSLGAPADSRSPTAPGDPGTATDCLEQWLGQGVDRAHSTLAVLISLKGLGIASSTRATFTKSAEARPKRAFGRVTSPTRNEAAGATYAYRDILSLSYGCIQAAPSRLGGQPRFSLERHGMSASLQAPGWTG